MYNGKTPLLFLFLLFFTGILVSCGSSDEEEEPASSTLQVSEIAIGGKVNQTNFKGVPVDLEAKVVFSEALDPNSINGNIVLRDSLNADIPVTCTYDGDKTVELRSNASLKAYSEYKLLVTSQMKSKTGLGIMAEKNCLVTTTYDGKDKMPRVSDEELLDIIQKQTFRYFWDFAHPVSGMARERTTSGETVTTGGTGFGVLAILVAAERNFISRSQAAERILKIVTFLEQKCTRYHGTFAHWINGNTGATIPFSTKDDGGDLVETALLFQGLLTARQYFGDTGNQTEAGIVQKITNLWEAVEWTWFQKDGEKALYWHWSPAFGWEMNLKISGWNEALITYVLAASSPTHAIEKEVYDQGWTKNGAFINGQSFYDIQLPLGERYGGPLFYAHYSFLGINPKGLSDQYTDYQTQNTNHSLINRAYCIANPLNQTGYGADCWGLTASDGDQGYSAHSPANDKGVIAPTAAISSLPYTPEESMQALRFFYYKLGDKLWGEYGLYDSFNLSANWFDDQYIAIDQGPIVGMIENYRSGLLWTYFMRDPEVKKGMAKLGFKSPLLN